MERCSGCSGLDPLLSSCIDSAARVYFLHARSPFPSVPLIHSYMERGREQVRVRRQRYGGRGKNGGGGGGGDRGGGGGRGERGAERLGIGTFFSLFFPRLVSRGRVEVRRRKKGKERNGEEVEGEGEAGERRRRLRRGDVYVKGL